MKRRGEWREKMGFSLLCFSLIRHLHTPIINLVCPPRFCISSVFYFSWDDCNTHPKVQEPILPDCNNIKTCKYITVDYLHLPFSISLSLFLSLWSLFKQALQVCSDSGGGKRKESCNYRCTSLEFEYLHQKS